MGENLLKVTMSRGEITPLAQQRQDLVLFKQSLARLLNWIVLKQGGVRRRSGTRYRGRTKFADKITRLISYTFSIGQSYILEMGDAYMRVWLSTGQVADPVTPSIPYELVTPWAHTDVRSLQYAPYNDTIFFAHTQYSPKKIKRNLSNSWTVSDAEFKDGPYLPVNDVGTYTATVSAAMTSGASVTVTWSAGAVALDPTLDIGRLVRLSIGSKWSWGTITGVSSPLIATVSIVDGQGGSGATTLWRLGAFYKYNYPGCVAFFEDRIVWAGVPDTPRTVYASYSGIPSLYTPSSPTDNVVTSAHGFSYEIARADPILWLKESSRLQIGTASGIRSLGGVNGAALSALSVTQRLEVKVGSDAIVPEQAGQSTVFVGRTAKRLNNLYYDYQVNGLVAPELSILSEHLFKLGVVDIAYQETPDGILWSCDTAGKLVATTIEENEDVKGFASCDVSGRVGSVSVIQPEDRDELWMTVSRTINGDDVQYVETLEAPYDEDLTNAEDAFIVDCGGTYEGPPIARVTGADWLKGEEVELHVDGARMPNVVVASDGGITLPNGRTGGKINFGLPIPNKIVTLEAPASADDGSTVGRRKRALSVILKTLSAQGLKVSSPNGMKELLVYRNAKAPLGQALPLNTGSFKAPLDDTWENEGQVEISVDGPFPATILALNVDVESEP